jgi:hypothetical protein
MISASQLTSEQIETIKSWAEDGARMADIQRRLGDELGLSATYMDTRFLMLDLGIELRDEAPMDEEPPVGGELETAEEPLVPEDAAGTGGVSVQLDQITKPGAMVSGRITFSDGERGMWWIDSTGRPGLDTETTGYRPSEADLMVFQTELRRLLEGGA